MKKLLLILCLMSVLSFELRADEVQETSGSCGATCLWSFDSETKTLSITGSGEMDNYSCGVCTKNQWTGSTAPWNDYRDDIENIVVEDGITSIGQAAFSYTAVSHIDIPDSVSSFGQWAFAGTKELESIKLPNNANLKELSDYMFSHSGIKYIDIPESIKEIGDWAFSGCQNLTNIVIPDNVDHIRHGAFNAVPASVTIYCQEGENKHNNKSCADLVDNEYTMFNGSTKIYSTDKDGHIVINKRAYETFDDASHGNYIKKRIYTIDEANQVAGKTNTFSIRYR